jgi:F-type H+-transporting ATPase subunit delta
VSDLSSAQVDRIDGYAAALFDIARVDGGSVDLVEEIHVAAHALSGNAELIEALRDPRIPGERKQGIVDQLLGSRASTTTVAAINFVIASGQARNLSEIAARLAELAAEAEGEVVAEVRAPLPLDADQTSRLQAALAHATNKKVQVKVVIDPTVVGGLVAKIGDTVLDGSIQGRFSELREQWG